MPIVLGIDPGSRITGFGLIHANGHELRYLDSGCIKTASATTLADKLCLIHQGISALIERYQPDEVGIEQVFMARNPDSALKLGQARGAAIVACTGFGLAINEYSARQVKQSVVGTGGADKSQVQAMVVRLLSLPKAPQADAADALGIAICHIHTAAGMARLLNSQKANTQRMRRGRVRIS